MIQVKHRLSGEILTFTQEYWSDLLQNRPAHAAKFDVIGNAPAPVAAAKKKVAVKNPKPAIAKVAATKKETIN